jgi:hypothetical protein
MAISLVKGRHAAECPCRICEIARETIEASRWQEAPEQPDTLPASAGLNHMRRQYQEYYCGLSRISGTE